MDIKFNIKGLSVIRGQIKVEDLDIGVSATEGETLNSNECIIEILENPAVQKLIEKFANEVSFKPTAPAPVNNSNTEDKLNALRSQMAAEQKATKKAVSDLVANQNRILALLEKRFM